MADNENFAVTTISINTDGLPVVHVYGPYNQSEAQRMARQLKIRGVEHSFARKMQLKNEVNAKPKSPKG